MKIGIEPSTQNDSWGNGIGRHHEAELCQDVTARLAPLLEAAGHKVGVFIGQKDSNSDGAEALSKWGADIAVSLHLDSANGFPGCLLCWQEQHALAIAQAVQGAYCEHMGIRNKGNQHRVPGQHIYRPDTGDGIATLSHPEAHGIPAFLLELGDMNIPDGLNWINPLHRERAAEALAKAITEVLGGKTPDKKQEDDMQSWDFENVTEAVKIDCYRDKADYWVTTDTEDRATRNIVFILQGKDGGKPIESAGQDQKKGIQHDHDICGKILGQDKFKGLKGSFKLTVKSADPINISIREVPKG